MENRKMSKPTADRDLRVLLTPFGKHGRFTMLVRVDEQGRIRARSVERITQELGLTRIGWVDIAEEAFASQQLFKELSFIHVGYTTNRNRRNKVLQSRATIAGMTGGVTPPTQRRREKMHGVIVTRNVARVHVAAKISYGKISPDVGEFHRRYTGRSRTKLGKSVIGIRNEYDCPLPGVSQLAKGCKKVVGKPAQYQKILQPEYDVRSMRQAFDRSEVSTVEALIVMEDILMAGADVDIFMGYAPDPETGEIIGWYERYMGETTRATTAKNTRPWPVSKHREFQGFPMR